MKELATYGFLFPYSMPRKLSTTPKFTFVSLNLREKEKFLSEYR